MRHMSVIAIAALVSALSACTFVHMAPGATKVKVLELLTPRLVPDGAFVLGAAETVLGLATKLTCDPQHRGLYRHVAMAPVAAAPAPGLRPRPAITANALRG